MMRVHGLLLQSRLDGGRAILLTGRPSDFPYKWIICMMNFCAEAGNLLEISATGGELGDFLRLRAGKLSADQQQIEDCLSCMPPRH